MSHLAYVHARPSTVDAAGIFYVGKGRKARAFNLVRRNPHHANVVTKYGAENILVGTIQCSNESTAFELERGLIKCLRRMGVKLTNMTDGGEGASGHIHNQETRNRMSVSVRAGLTDAVLASRGKAIKESLAKPDVHAKRVHALKEAWSSPELRKLKSSHSVELWEGVEYRALQKASRIKSWADPSAKKARSAAVKQGKSTLEAREKVSLVMKQVYSSPAMRQQASMRTKGTIWITNGVESRRVLPDAIPDGFVRGQRPRKAKPLSD